MAVGATFELTDHPRDDQNQSYLVTWARYRIKGQDARSTDDEEDPFTCTLVAIDAEVTFRPPLTTRKPVVRGPQTAMVVGPVGSGDLDRPVRPGEGAVSLGSARPERREQLVLGAGVAGVGGRARSARSSSRASATR